MARRSPPKPRSYSPEGLRKFCRSRTALIRRELETIGYTYGDVEEGIVRFCDELADQVGLLEISFDEAVEEGRGAL
ncbi:MAG: hypothetical protein ABI414_08820 [Devosia sp.]